MAAPKGNNHNPNGRPKGTANKVTTELKEMIRGALDDAGGQKYLKKQATENPAAFLTLIGKILPREITADINITTALANRMKSARERITN